MVSNLPVSPLRSLICGFRLDQKAVGFSYVQRLIVIFFFSRGQLVVFPPGKPHGTKLPFSFRRAGKSSKGATPVRELSKQSRKMTLFICQSLSSPLFLVS
eukprot:Hpha_TRINITY_DN22142_c0_g1::TRINITY_DN22142_c0_g1_i1::g.103597::m.103597